MLPRSPLLISDICAVSTYFNLFQRILADLGYNGKFTSNFQVIEFEKLAFFQRFSNLGFNDN